MEKIVKIVYLTNRQTLISEIEEVGADVGEPDCRLINAQVVGEDLGLEPFLLGVTMQDTFMISSDKILTLADPTPTLLEKYLKLTKE